MSAGLAKTSASREAPEPCGAACNSPAAGREVEFRKNSPESKSDLFKAWQEPRVDSRPHSADQHVGRQIAAVRVQSDISQAQLARSIGISFQQLQKYENARNRVSASMLFEIGSSLGVPVSRFFQGLPGNNEISSSTPPLLIDERLDFIASAEGRRLIEALMNIDPRVRKRVSALIATLGEQLAILDGKLS
ncbi:helix-turn-helix domain-containing protein [Mesorhizobium sp. M1A.F.Ca.ET.072.01.1.1]|nr:helix-turn-helix domain-containing protein [Mesorhizobium sp. M1A.F.Ca.ET.072.01.1.1]TIV00241.1 MAG: helix-turn-helix domain-containing protein [Mesorhizobium sp.]